MDILSSTLGLYLEAAPWLLLGFAIAGVVKAWVPEAVVARVLGGSGLWPITKAALIGAPLPLCSCGVLPAAAGLRRGGASRPATVSFLIATPETGPDSVALTYALLGPVMAVLRPVTAIASAVFAGLATALLTRGEPAEASAPATSGCGCGAVDATNANEIEDGCARDSCCVRDSCCAKGAKGGAWRRLVGGFRFAFTVIVDDVAHWLVLGLAAAGVVLALVPPMSLASWGQGLPAMLVMLVVGLPIYVCATASTPIAAAMLTVGVSPGTVLVFLLVGPATNIASMGVVGRLLGRRALAGYLGGIIFASLGLGLMTDAVFNAAGFEVAAQLTQAGEVIPEWLELLSGAILAPMLAWPLTRRVARRFTRRSPASA